MNGDLSAKLDSILTDPAMMAQIKALADTMTKGSDPPPSVDGNAMPALSESEEKPSDARANLPSLFSSDESLAKNAKHTRALLLALKPYLDDRRCEKIDKMLNMLRLAEMAGYFKNLM